VAIVKMNKITVLGLINERASLLKSLLELGVVDINEEEPGEGLKDKAKKPHVQADLLKVDTQISELARAIDILSVHAPVKKPFFSARRVISEADYSAIMEKMDEVFVKAERINDLEDDLIRMRSEENRLQALMHSLEPWLDMDIPLDVPATRYTQCWLGHVPARADMGMLENDLQKAFPEAVILKGRGDREHQYMAIIFHKSGESDVLPVLRNYNFSRITLRDVEGTARDSRDRLQSKLNALYKEREEKLAQIKELAQERERLEVVSDGLRMERARIETRGRLIATRSTFILKGWLPAELSGKVEELLNAKYFCCVTIEEPEPEEEFPVLIKNGPIVEAASPVLDMYGVPSSKELDPSAFMLVFYVFFFGLMLGDGGYGLILALGTGFILKKFRLEDGTRRFIKLLFYCGLSTMFAGILFGSWFGISALSKTALWIVPTENPELMMSWSILFGIIHMFTGFFIKGINYIRRGQIWDAICDVLFIYILFTGFVLSLLPFAPGLSVPSSSGIVKVGYVLFAVGVALLLLTQGRHSKHWFGKIFGGVGKLYDIISFFSDCLSYTRILALGLASAIIGDIVNNMVGAFGNIVVRIIAGTLILLVGHTLNFALNALGAYVHSCRLQYLEFFGKFFEGGGTAFKPFKANTQYIVVKTQTSEFLQSGTKAGVA